MAEAWNETWWYSDMLVSFVPHTAEVSCTFLCGRQMLEAYEELVCEPWDGWQAVLLAP